MCGGFSIAVGQALKCREPLPTEKVLACLVSGSSPHTMPLNTLPGAAVSLSCTPGHASTRHDSSAVASRLSYFVWGSSMATSSDSARPASPTHCKARTWWQRPVATSHSPVSWAPAAMYIRGDAGGPGSPKALWSARAGDIACIREPVGWLQLAACTCTGM